MRTVDELLAALSPQSLEAARSLLNWWVVGIDAVEPRHLVSRRLSLDAARIDRHVLIDRSVVILAVGKAAVPMAWGAQDALGDRIETGLVISDDDRSVPSWAALAVGGHPAPTIDSAIAAQQAIELVDAVERDQLLLALISGGGSSLMEIPHRPLQLGDVNDVVDQLVRSGAPIQTVNGVRSQVSQVKAGRLARRCAGSVATLVISDVGSDPSQVASGPTMSGVAAPEPVRQSFATYRVSGPASDRIVRFLDELESISARSEPTSATVLADGRTAGEAVVEAIGRSGATPRYVTDELAGDARTAASNAVSRTPDGEVGVFTGETTVVVSGNGLGGRNQHAALAAACDIAETNIRFLACGTDGIDGPTDAAGAYVDGRTVTDSAGAQRQLRGCNSYPFLDKSRALIRTGRTGTNVGDLWIVDKRG